MLDTDEKIAKGELIFKKEESKAKLDDYIFRIDELSILPIGPFWMGLYGV